MNEKNLNQEINWEPTIIGPNKYCPILVLLEPQIQDLHISWLSKICRNFGFKKGDIRLLKWAPDIPNNFKTASQKWKYVEPFKDIALKKIIELQFFCIVSFGELSTRLLTGAPAKITKCRGIPIKKDNTWVFPMLSPSYVNRIPENKNIFAADLEFLKRFMDNDFQYETPELEYEWIDHPLKAEPLDRYKILSIDTETDGGVRWWDENVKLLSIQIAISENKSYVFPVCDDWCGFQEKKDYEQNRSYLKGILENPQIKKLGFNNKFEQHMCRKINIEIQGWIHDAQLMLFNVDENLIGKSLEVGTKIYVPELSGYDDELNQNYDKSNMAAIPLETFIPYAAIDPIAALRLAKRLKPLLAKDKRQYRCYRKIHMPAIEAFANVVEPNGILVDKKELRNFSKELEEYLDKTYKKLIKFTPAKVKKKHYNEKKELCDLRFSRGEFLRDILFSEDGFNLTPLIFTDSTKELPDEQKVAATSAKHLLYFTTITNLITDDYLVRDYVTDLIGYKKADKLKTTYSGSEEEQTGLWQYLDKNNYIHPSYMLHVAKTARTSCADPPGQTWPVRGEWAPKFDKIFTTAPGFKRISCDLSQIELRIAAWMANEQTMLQIFQEGGDIHCKTAASVLGVPLEKFMQWKENNPEEFKRHRYNAKATNFGFLFGLGAKGFRIYAKTDYGVDFSEEECFEIRRKYFDLYWGLQIWHDIMREFVREHGYVRSLLGRVRHLPSIYSDDEAIRAMAERQGINSPIQSVASELGLIALTRFCRNRPKDIIKPNAFIHDDIRAEVKEEYVEEAAAALKWVVENPPWHWFDLECPVPILGEVKINRQEVEIAARKPDWWNEKTESIRSNYT